MITTWGQIDGSWIGRRVAVRWEDPSEPLADGHNSGVPHEYRGRVAPWSRDVMALEREGVTFVGVPEHAHVQEVTDGSE